MKNMNNFGSLIYQSEPALFPFGEFVVTLWRDWLTDAVLDEFGLNERQMRAIQFVKEKGRITSSEYQEITTVSRQTAYRDFDELVHKHVFEKKGESRKGSYYVLTKISRVY